MNIPQKIRAKLYRESKYLRRDIGYLLGCDESFYKNARGSQVLIYHGIYLMKERFTVNPFISPINQMHATITRQYEL